MTTPAEFLACIDGVVESVAFDLACTPRTVQEAWLRRFADRVGAQWCEVFKDCMSPSSVDSMVADVVERIRKRRDELEAAGVGLA
jgi:hypothetical protein